MCRFLALVPAVLCLAWIPPAAAEVGPTLHGEVLSQHTELVGPLTAPSCEDTGITPMELSFSAGADSRALGPIPGVFTLGAVEPDVGPPDSIVSMGLFPDGFDPGTAPDDFVPARPLDVVLAFFDIEPTQPSPITLVEIDGWLEDDGLGACALLDGSGPLSANGYYQDVRAFGGMYEATIYTPAGDYTDFGTMDLQARQGLLCSGVAPDFDAGTCPQDMLLSKTNDLGVRFTSERDTDEDGLIDAIDACPEAAAAGPSGCPGPPPPPPPPPPLDSDGDGKPDNADDCPGRPATDAERLPGRLSAGRDQAEADWQGEAVAQGHPAADRPGQLLRGRDRQGQRELGEAKALQELQGSPGRGRDGVVQAEAKAASERYAGNGG